MFQSHFLTALGLTPRVEALVKAAPSESNRSKDIESAAKRFANQNENEIHLIVEQKLQAARSALARLDYKNTHQICTEVSIRLTD